MLLGLQPATTSGLFRCSHKHNRRPQPQPQAVAICSCIQMHSTASSCTSLPAVMRGQCGQSTETAGASATWSNRMRLFCRCLCREIEAFASVEPSISGQHGPGTCVSSEDVSDHVDRAHVAYLLTPLHSSQITWVAFVQTSSTLLRQVVSRAPMPLA